MFKPLEALLSGELDGTKDDGHTIAKELQLLDNDKLDIST